MADGGGTTPPDDGLRDHLDAVHAAAERLVREASSSVPPRGWAAPGDSEPPRDPFGGPELAALAQLAALARNAVPPELAQQVKDALRELLLALRALIDWYLERVERGPAPDPEVQDIPID
jgi:hypothetical protein